MNSSDTLSTISLNSSMDSSGSSSCSHSGIVVEEAGQMILHHGDFVPKKLSLYHYTLAALNEDGSKILLGEIRTRGGDDWTLTGKSLSVIDKTNEKRYLDLTLVPNAQHGHGGASVIFLAEKIKNKERFLTGHNVHHGKILELGDEFTCYDKTNVLGKGISHISADLSSGIPTVYSVSNLIRKLQLEDGGTTLKPTPARSQIPQECLDGTVALTVQSAKSSGHNSFVVGAFRTKSVTKNKFMIEWFVSSGKRDEISCCKTPIKLGDDCEPLFLLSDPKDGRVAYLIAKNGLTETSSTTTTTTTTALYKLNKGKRCEEPLIEWNFEVDQAVMGLSADQQVTLLIYDSTVHSAKIFLLTKSEGFRGKHPSCAHCPSLEALGSSSHIISCSSSHVKWQLSAQAASAANQFQVGLATLMDESGRYVQEPESGLAYRLRLIGCQTQSVHAEAMLLEDLERTFENADDRLAECTLKLCLNSAPCRDCQSLLSGWLMSGRLANVELYYVPSSTLTSLQESSERFLLKPISTDRFRSYITDMDWTTQIHGQQRQGTFTKNGEKSPIPVSRIQSAPGSRIPISKKVTEGSVIKDVLGDISIAMQNVLTSDSALRNNLSRLESNIKEIQRVVDGGET